MSEITRLTVDPLVTAVTDLLGASPDGSAAPPGALVAVAEGGRVRYAAGGLARHGTAGGTAVTSGSLTRHSTAGRPVEMSWATRTDAGSVSKVVGTTAALMALVDAGEVTLDAPIARHLPELDRHGTVRDLLEHRAGRWEWWPLYLKGVRGDDAVSLAARLPLRYRPGERRHYSDLGFILLGALVARVGGDLAAAVDELVLRPFGLTETRYATPAPGGPVAASSPGDTIEQDMIRTGVPYPVDGAVTDFDGWRDHVLVGEVNDGNAFHAFDGVAGHAGLFTTAADLLRFATGLLSRLDGDGPIRRDTVAEFLTAGADPHQALGFRVWDLPSGPAVGHTGFPGVAFAVLPEHRAGVVMITNRLHAGGPPRATERMWLRVLAAAEDHLRRPRWT
ncbi:serine hydrolase domain-containing protein [Actinoallomurus sp. CA-150999]|uniref:serine hydrolase domain-containing protein n=1 Tax=Actinoallomurus sp. CA-150999 TaxID=3239887 RepID=UPI003D8AC8A8